MTAASRQFAEGVVRQFRTHADAAMARARAVENALEDLLQKEREQIPLWAPVAAGFGIASWFWLPRDMAWIAFILATAGLAIGVFSVAGDKRWGRSFSLFCGLAAIGCALAWIRAEQVAAPRLERPMVVNLAGTVIAVEPLPARQTVRLLLRPDGMVLPEKVRVNVGEDAVPAKLRAGARISVRARLMPPAQMAVPGAYDFARVAWFQGIGATGNAIGPLVIEAAGSGGGWSVRLSEWRKDLSVHVQSRLQGGGAGIAAALATGDRGAISEDDAEAMRQSGLAHLLSISGLHVTAVVGAAMLLTLRLLALSPGMALRLPLVLIAAGVGASAGLGYTLLTGSEVPTVRSCIAALLVLAGIALGREAITLRLVATGALVVLLVRPEALAGPSFQLSFAAVTAIVALHDHPRMKAFLARQEEDGIPIRLGRGLLSLLVTGLVVEAALAPIALFHFHKAGLYGALANIVAIPLTTFVIMPAEALALILDTAGLGAPFWWIVQQSLDLMLTLAHRTSNAPGAVAMLPAMPAGAYALMIAGGIWIALWRTRWRRWGLLPVLAGMGWALSTPAPDLIVTGDGRHLALRAPDGGMALLRERAGDYVRDMLAESAGFPEELRALEGLPSVACSPDVCTANLVKNGRQWRLLATRSRHLLEFDPLRKACADADIVVSDRVLPRTCVPRWLKVDRAFLREQGGITITLDEAPIVRSVSESIGEHPWAQ